MLSPVSRKSAWQIWGFEKAKLDRNADKFGREFFFGGGAGRKICRTNLPSKFAEKFASNFPESRQARLQYSPQIRSAGPRAQEPFLPKIMPTSFFGRVSLLLKCFRVSGTTIRGIRVYTGVLPCLVPSCPQIIQIGISF